MYWEHVAANAKMKVRWIRCWSNAMLRFTFDAFNLVTEKTLSIFRFLIHIKQIMIFCLLKIARLVTLSIIRWIEKSNKLPRLRLFFYNNYDQSYLLLSLKRLDSCHGKLNILYLKIWNRLNRHLFLSSVDSGQRPKISAKLS